jgi:hypothetical protein
MDGEENILIAPRGHERAASSRDNLRLSMVQGVGACQQGGRLGPEVMTRRHGRLPCGGILLNGISQRPCGVYAILP